MIKFFFCCMTESKAKIQEKMDINWLILNKSINK